MTRLRAALSGWVQQGTPQCLALLLGPGLLLLGLVALDRTARQQARGWDRYALPFTAIDCPAPPGVPGPRFLSEVQYLAGLPDRLSLLDERLTADLAGAFARHPLVRAVERVERVPPGAVRVRLAFRTPVLAVVVAREEAGRLGRVPTVEVPSSRDELLRTAGRAVDEDGVLLPGGDTIRGLPLLQGTVPLPAGPAGTPWGDPGVLAAARTAALLRPHQEALELLYVEAQAGELVFTTPAGSRVLWGHAPGAEP